MKMKYLLFVLGIIIVANSSCSRKVVVVKKRTTVHRLPPGQAKKVTGAKSARSYAPGHQKKKH